MDDVYCVFTTFSWDLIPENIKNVCAKHFKVSQYLRMKVMGSASFSSRYTNRENQEFIIF